jgi:tripartite ATP-independent transporter DctP family solute receptor
MMDRRRFLALGLATTAGIPASLTAGCAARPAPAAEPSTRTVRLGDTVADGNPEVAAERYFGAQLAQLTDDRYAVQVFPSGTLGDHNRMNEQVRSGLLPMTKTLFSNLTAFDKRLGVLSVPYAFTRQADLFDALDGRLGQEIATILRPYGLLLLGFFDAGARNVYNRRRPVRTPADLKAMRIRVPQDAVAVDTFNALGAQATPLATNEIYSALQQGTIDGAENNVIFYVTNKHVDAARYWSWTRHQYGVDALLVSRKFFDALPPRDRDAFVEAGRLTVARERQLWQGETDSYVRQARERGAQINDDVDAAAFQRAVKPVLDKYRSTFADLATLLPIS